MMLLPRLLVVCWIALGSAAVRGADVATGERIYRQKCADCHGAQGEGVEGKYRDALYGDWALPKLTRYIAKNMPEDDPETLSAAEADAVSAYVFEAFYSRAAQARLRPARVELAHLTNQQYANAIADVIAGLGPARATGAAEEKAEPGLRAYYFSVAQRGRFDPSKIVWTGVDRAAELTVAEGAPGWERVGQYFEQFSAQWRGAVLAEETGEYEFVVRTPNSVRFWINAEFVAGDAALDVNVNRPDEPDHRVTVRLLGGREYPIGIDYWALPGKVGGPPPSIELRWKPPHGVERRIPARNLSTATVRPTFVVQTRFPAGDSSRGYERAGALSKELDAATTSAAFEVANFLARRMDRLAGTRDGDPQRLQKVARLAERFVAGAFRRPLTGDEKQRFVAEKFAGVAVGGDVDGAFKKVVLLALKAPQFLYAELPTTAADGGRGLGAHVIAGRLSWGLWDSVPDAALLRAATAGNLGTKAGARAEAERMLKDPRARAKLREFFAHWLQMRFVESVEKDPTLFPEFSPELIEDLRTSLALFLDEVAWSARSDFRELLRSEALWVNARLAAFYGLPEAARGGATPEEFVRVTAGDQRRAGVLTHPYLLAAFSYKATTSPIHRGVFLTRSVAGRALKSPPIAVAFDETEFSPEMTMRQKVEKLTRGEACQGCHAVINPLGFSLEWFDAAGRFRRAENGRAIDAVSEYLTDEGERVRLGEPRDVAEFALGNEQAQLGLVEALFHQMVKQPVLAFGPEALPRLREGFVASGYNLQRLLVEIVLVSAWHGVEPARAMNTPEF